MISFLCAFVKPSVCPPSLQVLFRVDEGNHVVDGHHRGTRIPPCLFVKHQRVQDFDPRSQHLGRAEDQVCQVRCPREGRSGEGAADHPEAVWTLRRPASPLCPPGEEKSVFMIPALGDERSHEGVGGNTDSSEFIAGLEGPGIDPDFQIKPSRPATLRLRLAPRRGSPYRRGSFPPSGSMCAGGPPSAAALPWFLHGALRPRTGPCGPD